MVNEGITFHSSLFYLLSCKNQSPANLALLRDDSNSKFSGRKIGLVLIGAACELASGIMVFAKGVFACFSMGASTLALLSGVSCASLCVGSFVLSQCIFHYLKKHRPVHLVPASAPTPISMASANANPVLSPIPALILTSDIFSEVESGIVEGVMRDYKITQSLLPVIAELKCVHLVQGYLGHPLQEEGEHTRAFDKLLSINVLRIDEAVKRRRDDLLEKWIVNFQYESMEEKARVIMSLSSVTLQYAHCDRIYTLCKNDFSSKFHFVLNIIPLNQVLGGGYIKDILEKEYTELDANEQKISGIVGLMGSFFSVIVQKNGAYLYIDKHPFIFDEFLDSFGTKRTAASLKGALDRLLYLRDHRAEREEWLRTWVKPRMMKA